MKGYCQIIPWKENWRNANKDESKYRKAKG